MWFKMLRRLFTGDVLHKVVVPISDGHVNLRLKLKRERSTGEAYVILSLSATGDQNIQYLSRENFGQLVEAVRDIQAALERVPPAWEEGR